MVLGLIVVIAWIVLVAVGVDLEELRRRPRAPFVELANLLGPHDAEPVHEAVPDDRRPDADPAGRVAGDGRADALPPRARLRRALPARDRPPAARLPHQERRARVRVQRLRRDGVGDGQPRPRRRPHPHLRGGQVRRALGPARRGVRRRPGPLRARLGGAARPRGGRPSPDREPRRQGRLRHAERDLDGHRARRAGDRRGRGPPRGDPRRRRRLRPRCRGAAPGRLGHRRGRLRVPEGTHVPTRAGLRLGLRARAPIRGVPWRRPLLLRLGPHGQEPAQGREPVHARRLALPRPRHRACR